MNRVFEYEGLRAVLTNKAVRDELVDYMQNPNQNLPDAADFLMSMGLECYQGSELELIVYVHKTPRKRPACAVVGARPANNCSATYAGGTYVISMFEAGDYDLAGSS